MCVNGTPDGPLLLDKSEDNLQVSEKPKLDRRSLDSALNMFATDSSLNCKRNEENLQLLKKIGSGSYGTVYSGIYFGETVAVKILRKGESSQEDTQRLCNDFRNEASIIGQKKSKYIIRQYEFSLEKRYIVMEHCEKGSLYDVIRRDDLKPIVHNWNQRLTWMIHVALGMHIVHNQQPAVLHRDLKSSNIFIDENWIAKVGDFGLSRLLRVGRGRRGMESVEDLNMIWQAPEVRNDKKFSTKSDVYSYGIIMHELLLLKGPYGFDSSDVHIQIRINNYINRGGGLYVPEDRSLLPGRWNPCLEEYIALMYRCCAEDPDDRPEFGEIIEILKGIETEYRNVIPKAEKIDRPCISTDVVKKVSTIGAVLCVFAMYIPMISHYTSGQSSICGYNAVLYIFQIIGFVHTITLVLAQFCPSMLINGWRTMCEQLHAIQTWFEDFLQQFHGTDLDCAEAPIIPSPFENGPPQTNESSDDEESDGECFSIPDPHLWNQIRESFLQELERSTSESNEDMIKFCTDHADGLSLSQWLYFVQILAKDELLESETWKEYKPFVVSSGHSLNRGCSSVPGKLIFQ